MHSALHNGATKIVIIFYSTKKSFSFFCHPAFLGGCGGCDTFEPSADSLRLSWQFGAYG